MAENEAWEKESSSSTSKGEWVSSWEDKGEILCFLDLVWELESFSPLLVTIWKKDLEVVGVVEEHLGGLPCLFCLINDGWLDCCFLARWEGRTAIPVPSPLASQTLISPDQFTPTPVPGKVVVEGEEEDVVFLIEGEVE